MDGCDEYNGVTLYANVGSDACRNLMGIINNAGLEVRVINGGRTTPVAEYKGSWFRSYKSISLRFNPPLDHD